MAIYKGGVEEIILSAVYSNCIKEGDSANLGQFDPGALAPLYYTNTLFYKRYN
jgi:hypothetical protein